MAFGIYDIRMPFTVYQYFLPADGTDPKPIVSWLGAPKVIVDIAITNSDTIAHVLNVLFYDGATHRQLGSVNIPAGQGYAGTPPIWLGASIVPPILQQWGLMYNEKLSLSLVVAMQADKILEAVGFGGYI